MSGEPHSMACALPMTKSEALTLLTTGGSHDRLKAARFLARYAEVHDLPILQQRRKAETVSYVKVSLDHAISRLAGRTALSKTKDQDEGEVPAEARHRIWTEAVEWVTGMILHEIASSFGLVRYSASKEIDNYQNSETRKRIDAVINIFKGVEQLKSASATPEVERFSIKSLILDILSSINYDDVSKIVYLEGPDHLDFGGDQTLLSLAISNGLRNAIEETKAIETKEPFPVVISWGETDVDYWVSIIDHGRGIAGSIEAVFDIGNTNKSGHSGFGLAIARLAASSLGGTVTLEAAATGGAKYLLRWEKNQ